MEAFQHRTLKPGQRVRVYVNLHKQGMFSIVDTKTGLVCAYAKSCLISDAIFFVSDKGREKVRKTGQKLVHAWVRGIFQEADLEQIEEYKEVYEYNPYHHEGFTNSEGRVINDAPFAIMADKKVYIRSSENDGTTKGYNQKTGNDTF